MLSELKKCHFFLSQLRTPLYKTIEALTDYKKIIHASIKEKKKQQQQAKTRFKKKRQQKSKKKKKQVKPLG